MSREHIWAEWIGKLIRPDPASFRIRLTRPDGTDEWRQEDPSVKVHMPCKTCNSEWMSRLEQKAMPIFSPMILGERSVLDSERHLAIATWAIKTAMVAEYIRAQEDKYYRPGERRMVMNLLVPPDFVWIWTGYYIGPWQYHASLHHLTITYSDGSAAPGLAVTIALGHLALQIFSYRPGEARASKDDLPATENLPIIAGPWEEGLSQVWPCPDTAMVWPPLHRFNDEGLTRLSDRFVTAGRPTPGP